MTTVVRHNLILLTSAVKVAPGADALHRNETRRLAETRLALLAIVAQRLYGQLVICDGSDTTIFTPEEIQTLSRQYQIQLEHLQFQQNTDLIAPFTKGIGEIEIVEYALRNSRLIRTHTSITKLSGRWNVRNMLQICKATRERSSFFYTFYPRGLMLRPYVHTALYKVTASALWRILEVARSDLMKERKPLEAAFYAALKNWNKEWIPVPYPDYEAFSGTRAVPIKDSMVARAARLLGTQLRQYCFSLK